MPPTNRQFDHRLYAFLNAFLVAVLLLGVFVGLNRHSMPTGVGQFLAYRITIKNFLLGGIFLLVTVLSFRAFGHSQPRGTPFWKEVVQIVKACTVASFFALVFPLTNVSGAFTVRTVVVFLPTAIFACLCGRIVSSVLIGRLAKAFRRRRDLIIVGSGPRAAELYRHVCERAPDYTRVLGFVDSPNGHFVAAEVERHLIGRLEELEGILMKQPVDEVLIALPAKSCYADIQTAIRTCESAGVEAKYLSDIFEVLLATPKFELFDRSPVVSLKMVQDDSRLLVKRGIDVVGAIVGLAVFGPLMLAIAVAIRWTSPGPALFAQERYGFRKRRFRMYKFRTMVTGAEALQPALESQNEAQGPAFKIRNDPRVTPIGRFLRRTSLDEFPQFLNVLRAEMSLVGPRPLPLRDVSRFEDACLMRRFSVKPGLTCLWQINGRSNADFDQWIQLDLRYIDTWSLSLDLEILVKTFPSVLSGRGAV